MGSCVSLDKDPEAAIKLRLSLASDNHNLLIPSPLKDTDALKSHWSTAASRDFGSKEESFFDTNPWLESDCDDDFFSVNGDFTPSRGNTPVHHKFSVGIPRSGGGCIPLPEPSPKKRLSELFSESVRDEVNGGERNVIAGQKSASETHISGANRGCGGEGSTRNCKSPGQKSAKSTQCCLPSLRYSRTSNERK